MDQLDVLERFLNIKRERRRFVLECAKLFLNNRNKGDIRKHASFKDISFFLCGRNQYFVSDRIGGLFVQSTLGALSESVVHKLVLLNLVNLKKQ